MIRAGANTVLPILIAASVLTACGPSATVEPEGQDETPPLLVESTSTTMPVTAAPTGPAPSSPIRLHLLMRSTAAESSRQWS